MHPGPINRGVEISSEVADSDQSIILDQVENGVALRSVRGYDNLIDSICIITYAVYAGDRENKACTCLVCTVVHREVLIFAN